MSDAESKARLLRYRTQLVAISILRQKKSEIVIKSALWKNTYQAQLETAQLQKKITALDKAKRDIIIVAVTGIAACVGAAVIAGVSAKAAGTAYVTGSLATPVITGTTTATLATGSEITIVGTQALSLTLRQWIAGQLLKTVFLSIPVGMALKKYAGGTALSISEEMIAKFLDGTKFKDEEFEELREALIANSKGDERFRRILSDPNVRREQWQKLVRDKLNDMVGQYISSSIMGVPKPANAILLMSKAELSRWYFKFRNDVNAYIKKNYGTLSTDEMLILKNNLMWEFWNDVANQLNSMDYKWHNNSKLLEKAIKDEIFSVSNLLRPAPRK